MCSSDLISVFWPTIDVLWVANQLTAPTSAVPCRNFSTVIAGSIAAGKKALSDAGYTVMDRASKAFWMKMQEVNREGWTGQKLDITTWEDEISYITWALTAIDGLGYVLTTVLLVIIAVGIMNSLWIAIRERTREIGTLRAIGMRRRGVMAMFVLEAFFLGAMGTAVGAGLGCLGALAMNALNLPVPEGAQFFTMSTHLRFALEPARVAGGAAFITLCCTLVSLMPSYKAAKMRPVTAISHVG